MDSVAMRIFELADKQFAEQQDFAVAIGKKPSVVSQWRMGRTKSYRSCLPKIAEVLGTTTDYLTKGEGSISWPAPVSACLDPESMDVAAAYQQADERSRAMVRLALGLDDNMAIAARGGRVVKKPSPTSAETLDRLSRATEKEAKKENDQF